MKMMKRTVAFVLLLALVVSMLPTQISRAAEVMRRYELDTDGIDVGATYLIVNTATAGSGNALRFYYASSSNNDLNNQALTIRSEDGVVFIDSGFTNESDCQFQFTGASAGSVTHGNYSLNLQDSEYENGSTSNTLSFTNVGKGQYRIQQSYWFWNYYLRYNNGKWSGSTSSSSVYLFKLTEYIVGYDVTFDGNGYTAGVLPEGASMLSSGDQFTIPEPKEPLRKDVGEDTYLFRCWNTTADGTGTEYRPGDVITVTEDITLYAAWYQQTKYTVSMITYLDGVPTDVDKIAGYDRTFYAVLEGGDGTYIPLTRRSDGTYSAKVVENGTYTIYAKSAADEYEPVHGHSVIIYGQDGSTECLHYSVSYDANTGVWAEGEAPAVKYYHFGEAVTAYDKIPTKEGNRFLYWLDQNNVQISPSQLITDGISEKTTLTAAWEETVTVTVNVVLNHNAKTTGQDNDQTKRDVIFTLMREENGVSLPIAEKVLTGGTTNADNITTYQVVFEDMPQGVYRAASTKSNYEGVISYAGNSSEDQTVTIELQYAPENFDLTFDVEVKADTEEEKALMPKAVNVKVTYWGYNEAGELGWHTITQQAGDKAPTSITIDENGKGTGFYPVWRYWSGSVQAYEYRLEVTSIVLPDGSIVPASGDMVVYTANGSGLYQATVTVDDACRVPSYPDESDTELSGAYYDGQKQSGALKVVMEITPFTVTFDAGDGLVNEQQTITLENQYRYPSLRDYVAVPNAEDKLFICWTDADGNPVEDLGGQLLTENVTYYARYNEHITLSGTVSADATYQQDGQTVYINDIDRVTTVRVVLQKKVGDVYNDIDAAAVSLTYEKNEEGNYTVGLGNYSFSNLPNDGTEYRVRVLALNYDDLYDSDLDGTFSEEEGVAQIDTFMAKGQVNIQLTFAPDNYQQAIRVNASQIHEDLRPTGALAQILYRDLGDAHHYALISQHTVAPYGVMVELNAANASGLGFYDVWNWHTNGTLYEYQAQISMVYGNNVPGAYSEEGTPYTENSPFTIVYGPANNYMKQTAQNGAYLEATLVPKQYAVKLDLNLGDDEETPVLGLDEYVVDDKTGGLSYAFMHTWSYAEQFTAYPYREGYVFKGWSSPNTDDVYIQDGIIHVGNTLSNDITLTARWEKMSGTDYTIVYLELNTDKVLHNATMVSGSMQGSEVYASDHAIELDGYIYAGAMVAGVYQDKEENPVMTITNDPIKNLMVVYYLPDGSDGYTEQVESNLEINKTAVLENDGTYTITLDTYTKDNPITTLIQQNTPLDIVLVLDQSGSLAENNFAYLNELQVAVDNFIESVADHGRQNEVDHRIAIVGYAGNASDGHSSDPVKATGGKETDSWINTGVFDSNGEFHLYNVKGFEYTKLTDTSSIKADGVYYTKVTVDGQEKYLLLTYHNEYRHLITEEEARVAILQGQKVFGYVYNEQNEGGFVELTRNTSGLWLYGNKQLYSEQKFFTYHTDVWTHRDELSPRQIHAYGVGASYTPVDGHADIYTRDETTGNSYQQSIYEDALVPVSVGASGSGGTNPGLLRATESLGADGATRASYGMEMANKILEANPVDEDEGRVRLVVMFTDGEPGYLGFDNSSGDQYYNQAVTEANNAISYAYTTKNTYGAYVYTIGLYESAGVEATSEVAYYMNALSSNYPNAKKMDDIKAAVTYVQAPEGTELKDNGKMFVKYNNTYYEVKYGSVRVSGSNRSQYCWYYTRGYTNYSITTATYPSVGDNGKVGDYVIYQQTGGYAATENSGYYATTESADHLREYFENVLRDITTKITTEIVLESDTILRDIMNQGLVLTEGTVITAYTQEGNFNKETGEIVWAVDAQGDPILEKKVSLAMNSGKTSAVATSTELDQNGEPVRGVEIIAYNWGAENTTDPTKENYSPHTVDITGYDYYNWYISETHTKGYKMVVTITRVEAMDNVEWGRSTTTNHERSGLWLPEDEKGNRELLLPFEQPSTIFVERAYVLDYGKEFTLSDWYFDDELAQDGTVSKAAEAVHVDCNITNGMNYFDPESPNTTNAIGGAYGNTKYGNVKVNEDGTVTYAPTTMSWNGYDQFYIFGNTWRRTVISQDANQNGNLWNKVTVIPANNIYYEDSFITTEDTTQNGLDGFVFTGAWTVVGTDDNNEEKPEKQESAPYGDVHGWTDALADDKTFTDGTAHATGLNGEMAAKAVFTFTGTGVEVYTRTNAKSGIVMAVLYKITENENGVQTATSYKSLIMDNLAASGDYYHIPTVTFKDLPYGTYKLQLIATAGSTDGVKRYEYYVDGVRIHNPLGNTTNYQSDTVKDAYGLETNAVYTEVRDVLLDYGDFNTDMSDATDGKMGAVFIDWIRDGQGKGEDGVGTGLPSYELGTFEAYGPKNEVYLSSGQAIVLKVEESNTYYVGLKSLTGDEVAVNLSGIEQEEPTVIKVQHTTDLYYRVTPVNGYIVIQNGSVDTDLDGDGEVDPVILSITNLRTTNLIKPAANGGILGLSAQEAVELMHEYSAYMQEKQAEEKIPQPEEPEEDLPSVEEQVQENQERLTVLFGSVRQWLDDEEGGTE